MTDSAGGKDSLRDRLNFIGMDPASRAALAKLQPLIGQAIGPALGAFYDKVKTTPEPRKFFGDERHMSHAQTMQQSHWATLATARFDDEYAAAVSRIGKVHAKIGLEPRWYVAGYALVLEQLIHAIVKEQWPRLMQLAKGRPEGVAETLSALVKAAMLDMDLAISVYLEALGEQRRAAESAQEEVRREAATAVASIGEGLAKLAGKDLTVRLSGDIPEAFRKLQADFNAAIVQIEQALQGVTGSVDAIHSGSKEISAASDDLSRRTEQQAASLEQTAAALDEITATVRKSAEGAAHARRVVAAADDDAKKSAIVVRQAVEAMDAIAKSAKQISQIIGVIDEIAFQTNLLALNAGVEAARAGDAGRGFAVVASEVRALAQRSAEAAKEIKGLISASTTQVDAGVKLVAETGKSLERIMAQVGEINTVVGEISAGAQEQATGLQEVNTAINQMDQVTQQNAAMVEQSTAASHSLSQESQQLAHLIDQFTLGRSNGDAGMRRQLQKAAPHAFRPPAAAAAAKKPAPPVRAAPRAVVNGPAPAADPDGWEEF